MPRVLRWQSSTQAFIEPLAEGQALTMLRIPAGRFVMGSPDHESGRDDDEGPLHEVELQEFLMASTPITQAQWRAVAAWQPGPGETWRSPLPLDPSLFQGERASLSGGESDTSRRPVERISWEEAMEFCRRLSQRRRRRYTLPSEAQWEYACRAGSSTSHAFGSTLTAELATLRPGAGVVDDPRVADAQQTTPVQGHPDHPANAWGLRDMHGNVWEWCLDHWHANYRGAPHDGSAWIDANAPATADRVVRGGAWSDPPSDARSACRYRLPAESREPAIVGLRVVCLQGGVGGMFGKGQGFDPLPLSTGVKPLVYVSYAWRNRARAEQALEQSASIIDHDQMVDELCTVLAQDDQISVGRDKQLIKAGGSIDSVAADIVRGGLIIAVIGKEFLRSDSCMKDELLQAFRRRNFDLQEFGSDVLALVLDDALADFRDPESLISYWSQRLERKRKSLEKEDPQRKHSPRSWMDVADLEELLRVLPDLLQALRNYAIPRGVESIREGDFRAIRQLVMQRLQEKGLEVSG